MAKEKTEDKVDDVKNAAISLMKSKSNKDFHYNYHKVADAYQVSSGSIVLDSWIGGGFGSGLLRFTGGTEGGKTSAALAVMDNFIHTVENSRGLYIKAEGRLKQTVMDRTNIKFVIDPEEWENGTCLVLETNVFDFAFDFIRTIIKPENNKSKCRFNIIMDSMDGFIPACDIGKSTSDAAKVAAGALLSSDFLKRVSLGMAKFGHQCIMISQVRAKIQGQYDKVDPNARGSSSGPNAVSHYPDWTLEFLRRFKKHLILDKNNKIIGHICRVEIHKSDNETTGNIVEYPIIYGRKAGKSIWKEREVVDMLFMFELVTRSGAWYNFSPELIKESGGILPEKVQGMDAVYELVESDDEILLFLEKKVRELIQ